MSVWRVIVNDGERTLTQADGLYDVLTVDTFNPFGDYAKAYFDDLAGEITDIFERGTKVEFEYTEGIEDELVVRTSDTETIVSSENRIVGGATINGVLDVEGDLTSVDNTFNRDFVGFVVNTPETESDGAENLEVEAYRFDQFLRGNEVTNDQSGKLISEALEDVIKTDVPPVEWNANLVNVVNDDPLTRSYQNETVEEFLLDLRAKSANEEFSVTEELEFAFSPTEIEPAPRNIDNSQWINHNLGIEGGETKNKVQVVYSDGDKAVVVDNSDDQLTIQENIGAVGPAVDANTITREAITNFEDAIDVGERYLEGREETLTGPVTTSDLINAQPGQVINITIAPRGIDTEFRIAENKTRWLGETNELTVVQKKGADDDILVEQSKTVKRIENRPRANSIIPTQVTDTRCGVTVATTADVDGTTTDNGVITNTLRDALIASWENNANPQIDSIAVGSGTTQPSRSDSGLGTQTNSASVSANFPDAQTVEWSASITQTGVTEVGLFAGTDLMARLRVPETDVNGTITITQSVANDEALSNGVVTQTGQTAIRDMIADNSPLAPTAYGYGSDSTDPAESDVSLGNELATVNLELIEAQSADTTTEFENILPSFSTTDPRKVDNGKLTVSPATFFYEAQDESNTNVIQDPGNLSDGAGVQFDSIGQSFSISFTPEYEIPKRELDLEIYGTTDNFTGSIEFNDSGGFSLSNSTDQNFLLGDFTGVNDGLVLPDSALSPGTTYDIKIEAEGNPLGTNTFSGSVTLDIVFLYDSTRISTTSLSFDGIDETYDGPKLYPANDSVSFDDSSTAQDAENAIWSQNWNNTDNDAQITIGIGSQTRIIDNPTLTGGQISENLSVASNNASTTQTTDVRLSRWTHDPSTTPSQNDAFQAISSHLIRAGVQQRKPDRIGVVKTSAVFDSGALDGTTIREAGHKDTNGEYLTRNLLPETDISTGQDVVSAERVSFNNP